MISTRQGAFSPQERHSHISFLVGCVEPAAPPNRCAVFALDGGVIVFLRPPVGELSRWAYKMPSSSSSDIGLPRSSLAIWACSSRSTSSLCAPGAGVQCRYVMPFRLQVSQIRMRHQTQRSPTIG